MSAAPTFAEVLREHMDRLGYASPNAWVIFDAYQARLYNLMDDAQPTPAEAVALATALNLSGGAWHDFLAAAGVALESDPA